MKPYEPVMHKYVSILIAGWAYISDQVKQMECRQFPNVACKLKSNNAFSNENFVGGPFKCILTFLSNLLERGNLC